MSLTYQAFAEPEQARAHLFVNVNQVMPGEWHAPPQGLVANHGSEAATPQIRASFAAGHRARIFVCTVSEDVSCAPLRFT